MGWWLVAMRAVAVAWQWWQREQKSRGGEGRNKGRAGKKKGRRTKRKSFQLHNLGDAFRWNPNTNLPKNLK
jgi:hypothetical protein